MTYRNDLDAANARIEALERERRELLDQQARLNGRLAPQSTKPPRSKQRWWRERWWQLRPASEHAPDDVGLGIVSVSIVVGFVIMMIVEWLTR